MPPEILIVELGEVGASIGLALARSGFEASLVGYDSDLSRGRLMADLGAVGHLARSLPEAARTADVVILAVPTPEVRPLLEEIAPALKPGAVVVDASPLKSATVTWARALLPQGRHYVGATPVLGALAMRMEVAPGDDLADAERFQGGLLAIVTPPGTPEEAADYALAIARALGADPLFITAAELDVLTVAVDALPALASAAFMRLASGAPSWRDMQRIAGRPLLVATLGATAKPPGKLAEEMLLSREHMIARIDALVAELLDLRALIEGDHLKTLTARLAGAVTAREEWIAARLAGTTTSPGDAEPEVRSRGLLKTLFGSLAGRRRNDEPD